MRHYQCDSPEAAARIVAACLLADGHVGMEEIQTLDSHEIEKRLTLRHGQFMTIVQTLCEDLSCATYLNWGDACRLDPAVVAQLAAEVRDSQLREDLIWLCKEVIHADRHISDGEAGFLRSLCGAWALPQQTQWVRPREVIRVVRAHRE